MTDSIRSWVNAVLEARKQRRVAAEQIITEFEPDSVESEVLTAFMYDYDAFKNMTETKDQRIRHLESRLQEAQEREAALWKLLADADNGGGLLPRERRELRRQAEATLNPDQEAPNARIH